MHRDHQTDLDLLARSIETQVVAAAADEIDHTIRSATTEVVGNPNARTIELWTPAVLSRDIWHEAIRIACKHHHLACDRALWVSIVDGNELPMFP